MGVCGIHRLAASYTPSTGNLAHTPPCVLTGNRTSDLSVRRLVLSPLGDRKLLNKVILLCGTSTNIKA